MTLIFIIRIKYTTTLLNNNQEEEDSAEKIKKKEREHRTAIPICQCINMTDSVNT